MLTFYLTAGFFAVDRLKSLRVTGSMFEGAAIFSMFDGGCMEMLLDKIVPSNGCKALIELA